MIKHLPTTLGLIWLLILAALLAGCNRKDAQSDTATVTPVQVAASTLASPFASPLLSPAPPTPTIAAPLPGRAAIRAGLISDITNAPVGGTSFYLVEAEGENGTVPLLLSGPSEDSIQGRTDLLGWFMMNDIPPGSYYLVLWAPMSWVVLTPADVNNTPIRFDLEAGQTVDLGEIRIIWP